MESKAPHANCEVCPLAGEPAALSSGPQGARVAIVGEAPGWHEAREGRAFVGMSGKLLDLILQHHGLDRESMLITNACLCRPAGNKQPPKQAVEACWPRLKAELEGCDTIVTLGNTSTQRVLGVRTGIMQMRTGGAKSSIHFPGARIIPTIHPAAALRNADHFPSIVRDIGKINKDMGTFEEPKYRVFDQSAEAIRAIQQLMPHRERLVVDIETSTEKDEDFSHPDALLCVGIGYKKGCVAVFAEEVMQDSSFRHWLGILLSGANITCHNGKFDVQVLIKQGILKPSQVSCLKNDTMLMSYVDDERPGAAGGVHGLKPLSAEISGAPAYDEELHQYADGAGFGTVPREVLYRYNAFDVACTWALEDYYNDIISRNPDLQKWYALLMRASRALTIIEMPGVQVSIDVLNELSQTLQGVMGKLRQEMAHLVANPNSPLQVKNAFAEIGINMGSTDKEQLTYIVERRVGGWHTLKKEQQEQAVWFAKSLLEYRRAAKMYGTYVKGIRQRLGPASSVYPTFLLHGTSSGRLACRNPNMQNQPREGRMRAMYVPRPGNTFVQADYAQAELRVLACLAEDAYLLDVFGATSRDIHGEVATQFFGAEWTKDQRVRAKAVVFGLAYGREAYSIAQEYNMSEADARRFLAAFFEMIPGVVQFQKDIEHHVFTLQQPLITPFGRHRRFWLITKENKTDIYKEALSYLPQSTASDICLTALCSLQEHLLVPGLLPPMEIHIPVHDSILVECPEEYKEDVASTLQDHMRQAGHETFPQVPWVIDVESGPSWGELEKLEL